MISWSEQRTRGGRSVCELIKTVSNRACWLAGFACALLLSPVVSSADDAARVEQQKFFEAKIRPLLASKCIQCHGAKKQEGKLRLDSLKAMLTGGENGPAIVPGRPDESLLISAVNYDSFEMPPTGKLGGQSLGALTAWIKRGAVWPNAKTDIIRSKADAGFTDEERAYWTFQPIRRPQVPRFASAAGAVHPIDAFILRKLKEHQLSPAPVADRRTLIRRVTFDLTGLPPTTAEMVEFLADDSSDDEAYGRLVDRLLASPQYGERWARHWLDIVRYADSDGYSADHYRPNAWHYRDYVVRSFNSDKPYDQFLREQLAGDELAPDDPDALTATAFLRLGIYEFNQRDARLHWSLIMDEVTDVVGESLLGFSVGCAKCHDHKFDPILRRDYYRLRAFFAPLQWRDDVTVASPEQRARHQRLLSQWKAKTAKIRQQIESIERPYIDAEVAKAIQLFPEEIQAIYSKSRQQRDSLEEQLAYLVHRQVLFAKQSLYAKAIKGQQRKKLDALQKELAAHDKQKPKPLPRLMTVSDTERPVVATFIPDDEERRPISPGVFSIIDPNDADCAPTVHALKSTGRRTALARWITHPGNPLTARVIVNRVWQYHFGRGIVSTPNEFGRMGQLPSHPELIDWLAHRLVSPVDANRNQQEQHAGFGWQLKPLHRLIVTSATYRQSAFHPQSKRYESIDPKNAFRWRADIRRLDAEQVRDAMLSVSGELDRRIGGAGVTSNKPRRSVYVRRMRNSPDTVLAAFDGAGGFHSTPVRDVTTTPSQTLLMLNGRFVLERAKALARRVVASGGQSDADRVDRVYEIVFGHAPSGNRRDRYIKFLQQQAESGETPGETSKELDEGRLTALVDLCHVLLNSNAFLYVE